MLLKREDLQPVFSFKLRGAYNKMAHLTPAERARGVICSSAGNHAQGVALAAQKLVRAWIDNLAACTVVEWLISPTFSKASRQVAALWSVVITIPADAQNPSFADGRAARR